MSSSSSESESLPTNQVERRKLKRSKPTMTLEQFSKYSDYAEKKKKYDPQSSRKQESSSSSISGESDPDCLCWEVAARRIKHYTSLLSEVFKEVAQLRAEKKQLQAELSALKKQGGDS